MGKYNSIIIISLFVILVVIIIVIFRLHKKRLSGDRVFYNLDNDQAYRNGIYKSVSLDFKPYMQQLFHSLDELNEKVKRSNNEISQTQYNAMRDIYQTAGILSKRINDYWYDKKYKKDFSYYIGLHYSSHLLANSLKSEQQNIKVAFVECKRRQVILSYQIEAAKRRQNKSMGEQRYLISKEIGDLCKHHKNISTWKNYIGNLNTKYNQRVTDQNIMTAKYRDYIADNFGVRGQNWRNRCRLRALARK